jgi:hypothetical protein
MHVPPTVPVRRRGAVAVLAAGLLLGLSAVALAQDPVYDIPAAPTPAQPPFDLPPNPPFDLPPATPPTAPEFIRPFPVVRIKGRLTASGARVTRLSVKAPAGTDVTVRCRRHGCPKRLSARTARTARPLRFRAFERKLRAGVRLIVTATRAGLIGKHVTIKIRRGRVPKRLDRCLEPGKTVPIACPQP